MTYAFTSTLLHGLAALVFLALGIQVIGRFGADRATLEAASFIESAIARRGQPA